MKRNIDMDEISDGKRYGLNEMARIGCNDCSGCSKCCENMGDSIILDPYDIFQLEKNTGKSFQEMLADCIQLNVVDGVILPNLNMVGEKEKCFFLNEEGRCSIHDFRPGFCRLFPLGRIYENNDFSYFLQKNECHVIEEERTYVKVKQWLNIKRIREYEEFITTWHYFLKDITLQYDKSKNEEWLKKKDMEILTIFYMTPYESEDFYQEFYSRYEKISR